MNYIEQINNFWDKFEQIQTRKKSYIGTYMYLLRVANQKRWKQGFFIDYADAMDSMQADKTGWYNDLQWLNDNGFIKYTKGKNQKELPYIEIIVLSEISESRQNARGKQTESIENANRTQTERSENALGTIYKQINNKTNKHLNEENTHEESENDLPDFVKASRLTAQAKKQQISEIEQRQYPFGGDEEIKNLFISFEKIWRQKKGADAMTLEQFNFFKEDIEKMGKIEAAKTLKISIQNNWAVLSINQQEKVSYDSGNKPQIVKYYNNSTATMYELLPIDQFEQKYCNQFDPNPLIISIGEMQLTSGGVPLKQLKNRFQEALKLLPKLSQKISAQ